MTQTLAEPKRKPRPSPPPPPSSPAGVAALPELPRRATAPRMTEAEPAEFVWNAKTYNMASEAGCFDGRRVQLLREKVWDMPSMGDPHRISINMGNQRLNRLVPEGHYVSCQVPLRLGHSEPEPDLAVVRGEPNVVNDDPNDVLLVIEVAHSSLALDRGLKASIYAEAGYKDYWITNIPERLVEVRRGPRRMPDGSWGYAELYRFGPGEEVALLALLARPELRVKVADLMPLNMLGAAPADDAPPAGVADAVDAPTE